MAMYKRNEYKKKLTEDGAKNLLIALSITTELRLLPESWQTEIGTTYRSTTVSHKGKLFSLLIHNSHCSPLPESDTVAFSLI